MNGPPFDAEVAHAVPEPGAAPLSAWYVLIAVCTEAKSASHAASRAGGNRLGNGLRCSSRRLRSTRRTGRWLGTLRLRQNDRHERIPRITTTMSVAIMAKPCSLAREGSFSLDTHQLRLALAKARARHTSSTTLCLRCRATLESKNLGTLVLQRRRQGPTAQVNPLA